MSATVLYMSMSLDGDAVSATVLYMSMSLDGFIAGPNEGPGNGLGDGGHRLHEWALSGADADRKAISGRLADVNGQVVDDAPRPERAPRRRGSGNRCRADP